MNLAKLNTDSQLNYLNANLQHCTTEFNWNHYITHFPEIPTAADCDWNMSNCPLGTAATLHARIKTALRNNPDNADSHLKAMQLNCHLMRRRILDYTGASHRQLNFHEEIDHFGYCRRPAHLNAQLADLLHAELKTFMDTNNHWRPLSLRKNGTIQMESRTIYNGPVSLVPHYMPKPLSLTSALVHGISKYGLAHYRTHVQFGAVRNIPGIPNHQWNETVPHIDGSGRTRVNRPMLPKGYPKTGLSWDETTVMTWMQEHNLIHPHHQNLIIIMNISSEPARLFLRGRNFASSLEPSGVLASSHSTKAMRFISLQTAGTPLVNQKKPRLKLSACTSYTAFTPLLLSKHSLHEPTLQTQTIHFVISTRSPTKHT